MKKYFFNKHMAGGLAVTIAVTGAFSILTHPVKSNGLGLFSNISLVAQAETPDENIILDSNDLDIVGSTIKGLKASGQSKIDGLLSQDKVFELSFDNNITATSIAPEAFNSKFMRKNNVQTRIHLIFSNSIKTISENAFLNNDAITSVVFNNGLEEIGENAFSGNSLVSITWGNTIKKIGNQAFFVNLSLTTLEFPDSVESIGKAAFAGNDFVGYPGNITSVKFGSGLKEIGNAAFSDNPKLETVTFGGALERINDQAFSNTGLKSVILDDTVTEIGIEAFSNNPNLASVKLGNSVKTIHNGAFQKCKISELNMPESVESIGDWAFDQNELTKVNIHHNIKKIGTHAFSNNKISNVIWDEYNVHMKIEDQYLGEIEGYVIPQGIFKNNQIRHITLPSNIVAIDDEAFAENEIESLTIPASVEYICNNAFNRYNRDSSHQMVLNFEEGSKIKKINFKAFLNAGITGHRVFPDGLEYIGDGAFNKNHITSVSFTNLNTFIHDSAFEENPILTIEGLNNKEWKDNYNWKHGLGMNAFYNTKTLKNVEFNHSSLNPEFNTIRTKTFAAGKLKSINFPAQINKILQDSGDAFAGNTGWYDGTRKVALYRVEQNGTTYKTDNSLPDDKYYVVNPVLFAFELKDKNGNDLYNTISPQSITIERENTAKIELAALEAIDYTNFKLGDKVTFTLKNIPEGYKLSQPGLSSLGNDRYEIVLDPNNSSIVTTVAYDDAEYKVGYKKTVISLKHQAEETTPTPPSVPSPSTPTVPVIPGQPDVTPEQPSTDVVNPDTPQDNTNTDVDITDQNAPLGNTNIDTTDVDDDISPLGTKKIAKKVKANKPNEVNVEDTKAPLGTLPRTGGSNDSALMLLGAALLGLGMVVKKKIR